MIFPDLSLAKLLELHSAQGAVEHARTQAEIYPDTRASFLPAAGGYAVFCGRNSPNSTAYGLGMSRPVSVEDLDLVEDFYKIRGRGVEIDVCPLADSSLVKLLSERAYRIRDFMNVYYLDFEEADVHFIPSPEFEIRVADEDEAREWFERADFGGDWAEPDGISFMTIRCTLKKGARLYLAWKDGQMAGGGGLFIQEKTASLMAAATLPEYRSQGIQTALLRARLGAAVEAGCDLAMVHTTPGSDSQRNVLRTGFHLAYTLARMYLPFQTG
ncbi:MAG: GNAT family N-acetyltransferase [Chloroflexi bacterium]|nr:MAG: GNAT family N-acetyltransferase [Chloroflexota bacterium]